MENISKHISYAEATATNVNAPNVPNATQLAAMKLLAAKVFEPMRAHFGKPIRITSFFRSAAVNQAVGGSKTSQHCFGEAMDISNGATGSPSNRDIFNYIRQNLEFDQLIWELGDSRQPQWVHVSFNSDGPNRKQVLRATRNSSGVIVYDKFV